MSKYRVVVPLSNPTEQVLDRYGYEMEALRAFDVMFEECHNSEKEFIRAAQDASAVYVRGVNVTRRMIEALSRCQLIVLGSVGTEYIDMDAAEEKGIPVANCPDTFTEEVADHTMMLLLATHRRALEQDHFVRTGRWKEGRAQLMKVHRLRGLALGLVGFGRVGRAVASRAQAFGLRVLACDPFVDEQSIVNAGVEPVSLTELLANADCISLHLPETIATVGILGEIQFQQMKTGTIVINTGRGASIEETALIKALNEGRLAGAGLDVFAVEPISLQNPLLSISNVILSAHSASASTRFEPARKRRVGQELALVFSGRWPMSCVNWSVLSRSNLKPWRATQI